jgi:VIT1/CCC1 family predicted Fe2+/Mn2+ transporter
MMPLAKSPEAHPPENAGRAVTAPERGIRMAALTQLSYGGTAAIVTSMGLIVGFDTARASQATLVGSLLLIAVADNLADSLAIHAYQESERLAAKQAFRSTVTNFLTRFLVAGSFVILALALPLGRLTPAAVVWGLALLGTLTYFVARGRAASPALEVAKHIGVAIVVIAVSRAIGTWILARVSG